MAIPGELPVEWVDPIMLVLQLRYLFVHLPLAAYGFTQLSVGP